MTTYRLTLKTPIDPFFSSFLHNHDMTFEADSDEEAWEYVVNNVRLSGNASWDLIKLQETTVKTDITPSLMKELRTQKLKEKQKEERRSLFQKLKAEFEPVLNP